MKCREAGYPDFFKGAGFFLCLLWLLFYVIPLPAEADDYEFDIKKEAAKGDPEAQYALALLYEYGGRTVVRDAATASQWLKKAGQKKVAGACLNLGLKYENGNGLEQNYGLARCWYGCAVQQEWPMAMFLLARLYQEGLGGKKSYLTALALLDLAREQDFPKAADEFDRLQKKVSRDELKQLRFVRNEILQPVVIEECLQAPR